jgi:hypothetical protein
MSNTATEVSAFAQVKAFVDARAEEMINNELPLLVNIDKDELWEVYHNAFEREEWKQENACSTCKSFIRTAGAMVTIDPETLHVRTLWESPGGELMNDEHRAPHAALDAYVRSRLESHGIEGLYFHSEPHAGVDKNKDSTRDIYWSHYHVKIPRALINKDNVVGRKSASFVDDRNVLHRALEELDLNAMETVLEIIDQGSLYKGPEYQRQVQILLDLKKQFEELGSDSERELFSWVQAAGQGPAVCRVRNQAIGQLLIDLSEGMDLERAVQRFENMVAPTNYKRPKALVTERMVNEAKKTLQELGLMEALNRRQLDSRDITVADALFVHRPKATAAGDVFDELAGEAPMTKQQLDKVEEIPVADFLEKVVPKAEAMSVLFEREHLGNLVALTGPQDPEAHGLMSWDNSFAWSYTGGVADSIKEKVRKAGGRVENVWMRCSLSWFNHDDLDLHLRGAQGHVYYGDTFDAAMRARLDVDMNAGKLVRDPVENIFIENVLPVGRYHFSVHNFAKREMHDQGFDVEIEIGDETRTYGMPQNPASQSFSPEIVFSVNEDGRVTWEDNSMSKTASGMSKWGLKTGQFHQVRALTTSPNHWTSPQGNKHLFFLLEGCVADEKIRPFYNEFLTKELQKDRKVCEVLGGKIEVAPAEGAELSGLGFSETIRHHLYVRVEGKFKRTVKVLF